MLQQQQLSKQELSQIREILETHEKYRNSYFWTVRLNAAGRRAREFDNEYIFTFAGQQVEVKQMLDISCRNYYYSLRVYVDQEKKDIRALKKILRAYQ
jgi:hypothetical protein